MQTSVTKFLDSLSVIQWSYFTESFIVAWLIIILSVMFYYILKKKTYTKRQLRLLKYRISYVAIAICLILLARVWLSDFVHFLTILSLVAAGLIVVNKESVMNLVGSLIINWRDLFAEGDYVQFNQYRGYVYSLGIFYFTLQVSNSENIAEPTGKVVRIPNGMLITNPVVNYSANGGVLHEELQIVLDNTGDVSHIKQVVYEATVQVLEPYKKMYISTNNLSRIAAQEPSVIIRLQAEKPFGILAQITFYCFFKDAEEIKTALFEVLIKKFQNDEQARLIRSGG